MLTFTPLLKQTHPYPVQKTINIMTMNRLLLLMLAIAPLLITACSDSQKNEEETIHPKELSQRATKAYVNSMSEFLLKDTNIMKKSKEIEQKNKISANKKTMKAVRSVQDCIKPNNLIDDEVQMCVNGTIEKNW